MQIGATCKKLSVLLGLLFGILITATTTWASTRIGNAELQMWYRMRHTFHTAGGEGFDWVQWRNEVFFWLVYDDFVKDGKILGQDSLALPFVKSGTFNARYRFRADPTWTLRKYYTERYTRQERKSYLFPENGFRDLFVDLDFGEVGIGKLSARVGNQQIVWGESDLFRSIDTINPLRIDQNQGAGEKFDEFRSPIWALKLNYYVGNVGSWFSNVFVEPFYTPGFRGPSSNLIINGGLLRQPFRLKGCLDDNDNLVEYSPQACSFRRADGSRVMVPWNPSWRDRRSSRHPWAFFGRSQNPRAGTPDFATTSGYQNIRNGVTSYVPQVYKGNCKGPLNGMWQGCTTAMGFRIFGTSVLGADFSLNYANIPQGLSATFNFSQFANATQNVYGDADTATALGLGTPKGTFEEGLRRCLNNQGSQGNAINSPSQNEPGQNQGTALVGADLNGYNNPARFGKNGALQPDGSVKPGRQGAIRPPLTLCAPAHYNWTRTNIVGITSTYNDFEYTGAVFRFEQSWSSKEWVRKLPAFTGRNVNLTGQTAARNLAFSLQDDYTTFTPVWRSMVGFDLLKSVPSFKYIPFLHRSFSEQAWFFTGQWLMKNQWSNIANPLCYVVDNAGNGLTKEQAKQQSRERGGKVYSNPQCRNYRWEHLFTVAAVNQGLFASRVETRNAVAFEPRAKDWLLFSQWWWRNVLGFEKVELSAGVAWYPGSSMSQGWSGIYAFADRDQVWMEFTYYLL